MEKSVNGNATLVPEHIGFIIIISRCVWGVVGRRWLIWVRGQSSGKYNFQTLPSWCLWANQQSVLTDGDRGDDDVFDEESEDSLSQDHGAAAVAED